MSEHTESNAVSEVEALPDAGLTQFQAMNHLVDFEKEESDRAIERLDKYSGQLRRDAAVVDAAKEAIISGDLSPEEALQSILYECHVICHDDFTCHHTPKNVINDVCGDCGKNVPIIPGFEAGRRNK